MNNSNLSVEHSSGFSGALGLEVQRQVLRCSFCGLGEGEVARLFEGHSGYICDECVDVCVQLLQDYREMGIRPPRVNQPWYKKLFGDNGGTSNACSFNIHDRSNPQGERLFPGINAQICEKCVRACEVLKSSLILGG
ncbi:MAG TPA: ClpX C4-type zinc finger protein [Blastocatellia bacterium]|nr:ClpX C4-type zinc finger protein [Blastocatellia bacterium]